MALEPGAKTWYKTMKSVIKNNFRTWIEIDKKALEHNFKEFLELIPSKTRLMAVVKSNAYGHGLVQVAKLLATLHPTSYTLHPRLWFGVDSIVEALRLRREGIKSPTLVLGLTLPERFKEAAAHNIAVTISSLKNLEAIGRLKTRPQFHLKIDTGMHRQGFFLREMPRIIKALKHFHMVPSGIYTHFASAKDITYPSFTQDQLKQFLSAVDMIRRAGFKNIIRHSAASGGTLLFPKSHLDMARVGMGLYGYFPSPESKIQISGKVKLKPVLSWKAIVGEVKEIPKGSFIGYDLTEKVSQKTKIAVIPVGYWHGFDRGLSSVGEVLIAGKRRRVLGRVSMDMIVVDVSGGTNVGPGDEVVLIGRQGSAAIWADEIALKLGTSAYEILTRVNPLIYKLIK